MNTYKQKQGTHEDLCYYMNCHWTAKMVSSTTSLASYKIELTGLCARWRSCQRRWSNTLRHEPPALPELMAPMADQETELAAEFPPCRRPWPRPPRSSQHIRRRSVGTRIAVPLELEPRRTWRCRGLLFGGRFRNFKKKEVVSKWPPKRRSFWLFLCFAKFALSFGYWLKTYLKKEGRLALFCVL
jgi:hypothetical protein